MGSIIICWNNHSGVTRWPLAATVLLIPMETVSAVVHISQPCFCSDHIATVRLSSETMIRGWQLTELLFEIPKVDMTQSFKNADSILKYPFIFHY
jgi:hypothetical protein